MLGEGAVLTRGGRRRRSKGRAHAEAEVSHPVTSKVQRVREGSPSAIEETRAQRVGGEGWCRCGAASPPARTAPTHARRELSGSSSWVGGGAGCGGADGSINNRQAAGTAGRRWNLRCRAGLSFPGRTGGRGERGSVSLWSHRSHWQWAARARIRCSGPSASGNLCKGRTGAHSLFTADSLTADFRVRFQRGVHWGLTRRRLSRSATVLLCSPCHRRIWTRPSLDTIKVGFWTQFYVSKFFLYKWIDFFKFMSNFWNSYAPKRPYKIQL
jgi:hypothetical protein